MSNPIPKEGMLKEKLILSVVVVITGVVHVDLVNPGTHSTPTFTFTSMSVICIESESASVPSGKSVSSRVNLAVPSTPFLGALILGYLLLDILD